MFFKTNITCCVLQSMKHCFFPKTQNRTWKISVVVYHNLWYAMDHSVYYIQYNIICVCVRDAAAAPLSRPYVEIVTELGRPWYKKRGLSDPEPR